MRRRQKPKPRTSENPAGFFSVSSLPLTSPTEAFAKCHFGLINTKGEYVRISRSDKPGHPRSNQVNPNVLVLEEGSLLMSIPNSKDGSQSPEIYRLEIKINPGEHRHMILARWSKKEFDIEKRIYRSKDKNIKGQPLLERPGLDLEELLPDNFGVSVLKVHHLKGSLVAIFFSIDYIIPPPNEETVNPLYHIVLFINFPKWTYQSLAHKDYQVRIIIPIRRHPQAMPVKNVACLELLPPFRPAEVTIRGFRKENKNEEEIERVREKYLNEQLIKYHLTDEGLMEEKINILRELKIM